MKIEQLQLQGSGQFIEDRLVVRSRQRLFGVFDGASSLVPQLYQQRSGAWWAAELAWQTFCQQPDDTLLDLARQANQDIAHHMTRFAIDRRNPLHCWSTSAAVFRLLPNHLEWLQCGDCLILAIDRQGQAELLTPYSNHDAETFSQWTAQPDETLPQILQRLRPTIERVRLGMNRDYGVLNGDTAAEAFFCQGRITLDNIQHILAFSDGLLPPLARQGAMPDFSQLTRLYLQGGLEGLGQWVRFVEGRDPHCHRYPRFKCHDDVAALAISL